MHKPKFLTSHIKTERMKSRAAHSSHTLCLKAGKCVGARVNPTPYTFNS